MDPLACIVVTVQKVPHGRRFRFHEEGRDRDVFFKIREEVRRLKRHRVDPRLTHIEAMRIASGQKAEESEYDDAQYSTDDRARTVFSSSPPAPRANPLAQGFETHKYGGAQKYESNEEVAVNPEPIDVGLEYVQHRRQETKQDPDDAQSRE